MMNMQNLGLQESARVKCIDNIYTEFCLKCWFESDWYFGNTIELSFKCDPEKKFQTVTL